MPVTAMVIGAVAAPVIGGIMGGMSAAKDRAAQKKMIKKALAELEKVGVPPDLSGPLLLREFQSAGIYTPQLEEDLSSEVQESVVAQIKEDPGLREAQMRALNSMQQRAKVGLSAEDRAALNQVRSEVQRDSEAKRQQIMQTMQSRGQGGGGADLMAQLQSAQGAADQAAAGSDALMAQASQRALQALSQSGQMAGDVRSQDFGVEQTKASAIDERNRFLAENSIARQRANVGSLNQAQQLNLAEQQRISAANTAQANAEIQRQAQAKRDLYQDKLDLAKAKGAAQMAQAAAAGQRADRTAAQWSGAGAAIGSGITAYGQAQAANPNSSMNLERTGLAQDAAGGTTGYSRAYMSSDENLKENVDYSDDEVQHWLDSLGKRFKRGQNE